MADNLPNHFGSNDFNTISPGDSNSETLPIAIEESRPSTRARPDFEADGTMQDIANLIDRPALPTPGLFDSYTASRMRDVFCKNYIKALAEMFLEQLTSPLSNRDQDYVYRLMSLNIIEMRDKGRLDPREEGILIGETLYKQTLLEESTTGKIFRFIDFVKTHMDTVYEYECKIASHPEVAQFFLFLHRKFLQSVEPDHVLV